MTTAEFKKAKIIDKLKANLFFIGNYKGPIDFYKIDSEYATLFNNFRVGLKHFVDDLSTIDKVADGSDDTILVELYVNISHSFYKYIFQTAESNLKVKDVFNIVQLTADGQWVLHYWKIFCYLLEVRYHKKFSAGHFDGHYSWNYNTDKANFVCPADTEEYVYDEAATSCWGDSVDCCIIDF